MRKIIGWISFAVAIKLIILGFIAYITPTYLPFAGTFAYTETITRYSLPHALSAFASFDGTHYLLIANNGYTLYQQAFFPVFPLLIRFLTVVTKNALISGLFIAWVSYTAALVVLVALVKKTLPKANYFALICFLLVFPTSFFFYGVYTESIFLLLMSLFLYAISYQKLFVAGAIAAIASGTRIIGITLIIPLFIACFSFWKKSKKRQIWRLWVCLLPFIGLGLYMIYLKSDTGDPIFFIHSMPAFGVQRSSSIILLPQVVIRYIRIFFTARLDYHYLIAVFEFISFFFVGALTTAELFYQWQKRNMLWIGVGIFSLGNLILPTLTGSFSSIPRYSLLSLSAFMYLARIQNSFLRRATYIGFAILQAILFAYFSQGYFVS